MLWCGVITLFPQMFRAISEHGITRKAIEQGLLQIQCWDPRTFTQDKHRTVDDRPYGGGPGMVMKVAPLRKAIAAAKQAAEGPVKVVYLSPQGQPITQLKFGEIAAQAARYVFIAGRYEGIDERIIDLDIDEEWSIGDYVLSGGELAVMVVIDALTRWVPGALGHQASAKKDSFAEGLLNGPQYTRPEVIEGLRVPEVLLTGDHAAIARWRLKQKLGRTWLRRPDLIEKLMLDKAQQALLAEFIQEQEDNET